MSTKKKVLIITYYWPPAGGISLHRCLKFAKYLRDFGWEPIIYTAKDAQYPYYDDSNFKDIPEGITILKQKIIEPFGLFKKLSGRSKDDSLNNIVHVRSKKQRWIDQLAIWVRGNFFIPDARSLWIRPSVRFLQAYVSNHPVDAILSDGPPHTNTRIATLLKKATGIPLLADFQDPWTQVDYYPLMRLTSWADRVHRRMEQETFKLADKITIASKVWKQDLVSIGARNVDVIYWGYDEDDFEEPSQAPVSRSFTISHAGLMGHDRLPESLFGVLSRLCQEDRKFSEHLKLQFPGQIDYAVRAALSRYGLGSHLQVEGTLKRPDVLKMLCSSSVLLLLLNKAYNASGRVPGKFFEYLRARRPILSLGPQDGDVYEIIAKTNSGKSCTYDDETAMRHFILKHYQAFLEKRDTTTQGDISAYAVDRQVGKLADFLDKIVGHD